VSAEHAHPVDPDRVADAQSQLPDEDEVGRLVGMLGLLADPIRARILYALDVVDELCVGDLAIALGSTEDSVGYGLRVLRTAGLVRPRKQGRIVFDRLAEGFPEPLREHCLHALVELSHRVDRED